jgi:hypothetical protein
MGGSKFDSSKKPPRKITLSMAAEELAQELFVLRTVTLDDSAKLARRSICRLISVVDACSILMRQHGDLFAAAGAVSEVIEIAGQSYGSARSYDSAHRAAVGEAVHLLMSLWTRLDPAGQNEAVKEFLSDAGLADAAKATREFIPRIAAAVTKNKIGLSPKLVVDKWSEAKAELLQHLSARWQRDFSTILTRIKHERRRLAQSRQHDEAT